MNINAISQFNYNYKKQDKIYKDPSFKSVIPVKFFADGLISSSKEFNEKAYKEFYRILRNPKNKLEQDIRTNFVRTVRDYQIHSKPSKYFITSSSSDRKFYIFTGNEAEELAKYSDQIGYAQHEGLESCDTSDTYEAMVAKRKYGKKVNELVHSGSALKELIETPGGVAYNGELGLHINAKSNGLPGEKGYKLEITGTFFRKIKKDVQQEAKISTQGVSDKPVSRNSEKKAADSSKPETCEIPEGPWYEHFLTTRR